MKTNDKLLKAELLEKLASLAKEKADVKVKLRTLLKKEVALNKTDADREYDALVKKTVKLLSNKKNDYYRRADGKVLAERSDGSLVWHELGTWDQGVQRNGNWHILSPYHRYSGIRKPINVFPAEILKQLI